MIAVLQFLSISVSAGGKMLSIERLNSGAELDVSNPNRSDTEFMKNVPLRVRRWGEAFGLQWQAFLCPKHGKWYVELDCYFPYYEDKCFCEAC